MHGRTPRSSSDRWVPQQGRPSGPQAPPSAKTAGPAASVLTICVAGDMGQHMRDCPAGQQRRCACTVVGQAVDCRLESTLRISDASQISQRRRQRPSHAGQPCGPAMRASHADRAISGKCGRRTAGMLASLGQLGSPANSSTIATRLRAPRPPALPGSLIRRRAARTSRSPRCLATHWQMLVGRRSGGVGERGRRAGSRQPTARRAAPGRLEARGGRTRVQSGPPPQPDDRGERRPPPA